MPPLLTAIVLWLLVIPSFYGVIAAARRAGGRMGRPRARYRPQRSSRSSTCSNGPLSALQELRDALLPADRKGGIGVDMVSFVQQVVGVVAPGDRTVADLLWHAVLHAARPLADAPPAGGFFRDRDARLRVLNILNNIEHNLTGYLSIVDVDQCRRRCRRRPHRRGGRAADPVAWGVLGFVLNFIPYIGARSWSSACFWSGW